MIEGQGIINTLINKLPFELHLLGSQYCGPGTKLNRLLARGDSGINKLDQACREHDIVYSVNEDPHKRKVADQALADLAWDRLKVKNSGMSEKLASYAVTNAMNLNTKLGIRTNRKSRKCVSKLKKRRLPFRKNILRPIQEEISKHSRSGLDSGENIRLDLRAAKRALKRSGGKKNVQIARIIPIPKSGGFLIPLFADLSALGALIGGSAPVASAVNKAKDAKKRLKDSIRHNQAMEAIHVDRGLRAL